MLSEEDAENLKNYYQNRPSELLKALRVISFTRKQRAASLALAGAEDAMLGKRLLDQENNALKKKKPKLAAIQPLLKESLKPITEGVAEAYKIKKKGLGDLYDDENGWPAQSEKQLDHTNRDLNQEEKDGPKTNGSQSATVVKRNKNWLQIARSGPVEKNGIETLFSQVLSSYVSQNSRKFMDHLEKPSNDERPLRR